MKYYLFVIAALLYTPFVATAASCPVHTESAYKSNNNATVWYITPACTKQKFTSATMFFTYFDSWDNVQTISEGLLAQVETDDTTSMTAGPNYTPKNGDVIKTVNDPKVYFVIGSELRHIYDEVAYTGLGYRWDWIIDVDQAVIDRYTKGEAISYFTYQPTYALFKVVDNPKVYRIEPHPEDPKKNVYRHIANETVFHSLGYRFDRVLTVDPLELPNVDSNGSFTIIGKQIVHGLNPMSVFPEGAPITSSAAARNIDVRAAIKAEQEQSTIDGYAFRNEPLFGFSYVYPETYNIVEEHPSSELFGGYKVSYSDDSTQSDASLIVTATLFEPYAPYFTGMNRLDGLSEIERTQLLDEGVIPDSFLYGVNADPNNPLREYQTVTYQEHPELGRLTIIEREEAVPTEERNGQIVRLGSQGDSTSVFFVTDMGVYEIQVIYRETEFMSLKPTKTQMLEVLDTVLNSIKLR